MSEPTRNKISVALAYLDWLKRNVASKVPEKKLRALLDAAKEAEILGWRFMANETHISGKEMMETIERASLPLHINQKQPHARPRRYKILVGDEWVLERLKDGSGTAEIRGLVHLAVAESLLPKGQVETHVRRIYRILPQWLDNK